MKTYRTKYRDRKGKLKVCSTWHLTFTDRDGVRRRIQAYSNKAETVALGLKIGKVMENNGRLKTDADKKWFADLLPRIRKRLIEYGVVDGRNMIDWLTVPLSEHLRVFIETRRGKACKEYHIGQTESSIRRILNACGYKLWSDIDGTAVQKFLADGRGENGYGQGTYNGHLRAIKTFTKWLSDERGLTPDPLLNIRLIKQTKFRKQRRALTADEKSRLLTATKNGKRSGKMTAYARYLVYRIACETGMRYSEIRKLKVLSFQFDVNGTYSTVHVEPDCKGKEEKYIPLLEGTATEIKSFLTGKQPTDAVFSLPHNSHAAEMLRADLKAAGIEYRDAAGRDIDFHSLRGTFVTDLFRENVPAAVIQLLARHKDLKTTQRYCKLTLVDERKGIEALQRQNDAVLTVSCPNGIQRKTTIDKGRNENLAGVRKTAVSA